MEFVIASDHQASAGPDSSPGAAPSSQASIDRGSSFASELEQDRAHRAKARSVKPLRRLAPYVLAYPGLIAAFVFFLVLASGLTLTLPAAFRLVVDCGFGAAADAPACARFELGDQLAGYFGAGIVVAVLLGLASALRYYFISRLGERVVADLRARVYGHLLTLSPGFYATTRTGEVLSRLTTDTTLIQTVVGSSISIAVRTLATTLGAIILMFVVSPKLTLLVLLAGPAVLAPIILFGRRVQRLSRSSQDSLAEASARASEALRAIETVQAFTREPEENKRFASVVEDTFNVALRRIRVRAFMTAIIFGLSLAGLISVLWYGALQVKSGGVSPGEMTQFVMYAFVAVSGVGMLTETYAEIMRAAGATERLMEILGVKADITAPASPLRLAAAKSDTASGAQHARALAFDHVTFAYPGREATPALQDVSFSIRPGETVALVGPSGAGKSTIFQLLLRFYDPQKGVVSMDGVDLARLAPDDIRAQMAVVQQNAPLFAGSISENIRFGRPDASDDDVRAAAIAANASDFIARLPQGYDTDLGENGASLSGGQRQRIAIGRAFLRNAPVLLLDEATSALDSESEHAIQQAFEKISVGRTTLVIAHRLATVLRADRILVMDEGRIIDEGTHDALSRRGGLYARLAELQFGAATEAAE